LFANEILEELFSLVRFYLIFAVLGEDQILVRWCFLSLG